MIKEHSIQNKILCFFVSKRDKLCAVKTIVLTDKRKKIRFPEASMVGEKPSMIALAKPESRISELNNLLLSSIKFKDK